MLSAPLFALFRLLLVFVMQAALQALIELWVVFMMIVIATIHVFILD